MRFFIISQNEGVLIVQVMPNSPAANGGLKAGDVITQIDGEAVIQPSKVQDIVEKTPIGQNLSLQLDRQGRTLNLEIPVGILAR